MARHLLDQIDTVLVIRYAENLNYSRKQSVLTLDPLDIYNYTRPQVLLWAMA